MQTTYLATSLSKPPKLANRIWLTYFLVILSSVVFEGLRSINELPSKMLTEVASLWGSSPDGSVTVEDGLYMLSLLGGDMWKPILQGIIIATLLVPVLWYVTKKKHGPETYELGEGVSLKNDMHGLQLWAGDKFLSYVLMPQVMTFDNVIKLGESSGYLAGNNELLEHIASAAEKVKRADTKYYNEIGSDGENKAHQDLSANTQALNTAVREWVTGFYDAVKSQIPEMKPGFSGSFDTTKNMLRFIDKLIIGTTAVLAVLGSISVVTLYYSGSFITAFYQMVGYIVAIIFTAIIVILAVYFAAKRNRKSAQTIELVLDRLVNPEEKSRRAVTFTWDPEKQSADDKSLCSLTVTENNTENVGYFELNMTRGMLLGFAEQQAVAMRKSDIEEVKDFALNPTQEGAEAVLNIFEYSNLLRVRPLGLPDSI